MISEKDVIDVSESNRKYVFLAIHSYKLLNLNKEASEKDVNDAYDKKYKELLQSIQPKEEIDENKEILKNARDTILVILEVLKSCSRKAKIDWEDYFNAYEIYTKEHPALCAIMDTDQLYESLNSAIASGSAFLPFSYHSPLRERVPLDWENVWRKLAFYVFIIVGIPILILFWNIHPVLGIIGIVGYFWIAKNLWENLL
jgi:hypothetical protein